jgi:hypothetical protein
MQGSAEIHEMIVELPRSLDRRQTPCADSLHSEWSAAERLRRLFLEEVAGTTTLGASRHHDCASGTAANQGRAPERRPVRAVLENLLFLGRNSGEFETNTPMEEVSSSLMIILQTFSLSLRSSSARGSLDERSARLMNLALRSLRVNS